MAKIDKTYHQLLEKILTDGFKYEDSNRKGIYRYQIPHYQIRHDFQYGFPAITTKKLFWKGIVGELLWFLRGDTNIKYLVDNNINIWNKDTYNYYLKTNFHKKEQYTFEQYIKCIENNQESTLRNIHSKNSYNRLDELGRIYGAQWRDWRSYNQGFDEAIRTYRDQENQLDQVFNLIKGLKENPMGTRHIVTAWNPAELDDMALPPCHWSFEILVEPLNWFERTGLVKPSDHIKQKLDVKAIKNGKDSKVLDMEYYDSLNIPKYQFTLKWHQRSVDTFLGLPFNIASYALLAHIIGKMTNMIPKGIIGDLSNVHIYELHLDAVKEQLSRSTNYHNSKCDLKINKECKNILKDKNKSIDDIINLLDIEDFKLTPHHECKAIKAEMIPYK